MRFVELDLTDPEFLSLALQNYLSHGVCPASAEPLPAPFEEIELRVFLPHRESAVWTGRAIRNLGPGSFLMELAPPPSVPWLGSLLAPRKQTSELPIPSNKDIPEQDDEALADSVAGRRKRFSGGISGVESDYSDLYQRIGELSLNEKRQLARQGGKTARQLLIKDSNKTLHLFVFMNPKISLDEVEEFSKLPGLSAEAIRHMAQNRTWMASRTILFNLVRNPATPTDIAVAIVPKLGTSEWRVLTNTSSVRAAIASVARKLLFK